MTNSNNYENESGETWEDGVQAFAESWEDEVKTYPNGAKSSKLNVRYDLIPPNAMNEVAKVVALGCVKYGEWNWLNLPVGDNINHALRHTVALNLRHATQATQLDHAAHAACRALFVLEQLLRERDDNEEF